MDQNKAGVMKAQGPLSPKLSAPNDNNTGLAIVYTLSCILHQVRINESTQ